MSELDWEALGQTFLLQQDMHQNTLREGGREGVCASLPGMMQQNLLTTTQELGTELEYKWYTTIASIPILTHSMKHDICASYKYTTYICFLFALG